MIVLRDVIGDELRQVRLDKRMSLRDVAQSAMVSYSYLSELERGHKEVSSELLASICGALDIRMSEVLSKVSSKLEAAEEIR